MDETKKINVQDPELVAKAGLWYTICTFIFKAAAFLTTPFFVRYLSKEELGSFTDFASVASILLVITSVNMYRAVIRSKSDYAEDMDSFIWSVLSLSTLWTLVIYAVFLLFPSFFSNLLALDWKYIHILFGYLLMAPPYTLLITKQRAFYQYRKFVALTGIITLSGTFLSFILVLLMSNKLTGRIVGFYSPYIVIGGAIFILLAARGKKIKLDYWKYACSICIPMVPNDLALHILGVSDTILITRFCGSQYTAVYSVAYTIYHVATTLFDAMNKAWTPWMYDNLHIKNYEQIRKTSRFFVLIFAAIAMGILLVTPEAILIIGGKAYLDAIYCLPALMVSCTFMMLFTMYVNIEVYQKKTVGVSIATMIGTAINFVLNIVLLPLNPERSYITAAYTTLIGYVILFLIHYYFVKRIKMDHVYDIKFILMVLGVLIVTAASMNIIYSYTVIRYVMILIFGGIILYVLYKYKDMILSIVFSRKKKQKPQGE